MKKFLSLVLALVMTMSLVTIGASADFTDSSKITYKEAVEVVNAVKIVDGYADGSFNPTATLTRGAAAKIICNLILGPTTASALAADTAPYSDVPTTNTFAGYIAYCSSQGIISGYADGTFRPAATLTGYAFMKMLLGALGYNAKTEQYVGNNWSIAVAKRALSIGLNKGLTDTFNGVKAVTREEAALYAFNTLKATMVEYDNSSSITVGDITISSNSTAKEMANTGTTDGNIKKDTKMQFAEKYFTNLKKTATTDAFSRPATNWKNKTVNIGTYVDAADLTYTAAVKLGDIYSDLGLSKTMASGNVSFSKDGATEAASGMASDGTTAVTSLTLTKGDALKVGGNGVLTEVFYDSDNATAVVTMINTYAGKITATHAKTSAKDAYVSVAPATAGVGAAGTFETEETYKVDDVVLYTYSVQTGEGIQSVKAAAKVTGDMGAFTDSKNVTVGGTLYTASATYASSVTGLTGSVGYAADVYTDAYGYMVYLDTSKSSSNYAVVLDSAKSGFSNLVKLLFADGTTKTVTLDSNAAVPGAYNAGATGLSVNDIVTYAVDSDGEYTLTLRADGKAATASTTIVSKGDSTVNVNPANLIGTGATASAFNGKTIFLVKDNANKYSTYTGIANVPTVKMGGNAGIMAIYAKAGTGTVATVAYIDASVTGATVTGSSKDWVFVKGSSVGQSYTSEKGNYYSYTAIVNGEIKTIETTTQTLKDTLYSTVSYNTKGIATLANGVNASNTTYGTTAAYTTKTVAAANDVIGLGSAYYSYAKDVQVFFKDTDGNITASSINAIAKDDDNIVFVRFVDSEVATLVIQEVDGNAPVAPTVDTKDYKVNWNADGVTVNTVNYYTGKASDDATVVEVIIADLQAKGYTSFTTAKAGNVWTINATKGVVTVAFTFDITVTRTNTIVESVKVKLDGVDQLVKKGDTIANVGGTGTFAYKDGAATPIATSTAVVDGSTYVTGYYSFTVAPSTGAIVGLTYTVTNAAAVTYLKTGATYAMTVTVTGTATGTTAATMTATNATIAAVAGNVPGTTTANIAVTNPTTTTVVFTPTNSAVTSATSTYVVTATVGAGNVTFTFA